MQANDNKRKVIVFTGGGSAGHVVPSLALIKELQTLHGVEICYFGSNGKEKELITPLNIPYREIDCPKLIRGKDLQSLFKNLCIPIRLPRAVRQAKKHLKTVQPCVIFSKGGYVALPVVLAAKKLKIPCYTHESDFSLGLANKLIANRCLEVFTSFPETANTVKNGTFTGAPIRRELFEYDKIAAKVRFGFPLRKKVILILGGGSGSTAINEAVRKCLPQLQQYSILHLCGNGNVVPSTQKDYRQIEYLPTIGEAYAAADIVVSRAGAGAVFEIMALKKPSILIPLEGQTRGDQLENAAYFFKRGLCKILPQTSLDELPNLIEETLGDNELKARLQNSKFTCGNEKILDKLKSALP